jgi:NAD(P)-dependent dehydrogenase (short-subunit alcohol dehydrogenase family)
MQDFAGLTAVITGGGSGIGRELAIQLAEQGCSVAMCDVSVDGMTDTRRRALHQAPQGTRVASFVADVSDEDAVKAFAQSAPRDLDTDRIHLLFNNAGIGGGASIVSDERAQWEKTFNVCWWGVYYSTLAFLPLLMRASEARVVNVSSVNGFWASIGPGRAHSAYCAAKFAVKGFSEALITDLAANAPHVKCSVVMPGHIGTDIIANSRKILAGVDGKPDVTELRKGFAAWGVDLSSQTDEQVVTIAELQAQQFRETAPTTAAQAATIILDGVKAGKWRILVGKDAEYLDARVRAAPEEAYTPEFYASLLKETNWRI